VKILDNPWYSGFIRRGNMDDKKIIIAGFTAIIAIVAATWIFLGPECLIAKCVIIK
jgi:hypothetical protein